jgi:hypothetical protein
MSSRERAVRASSKARNAAVAVRRTITSPGSDAMVSRNCCRWAARARISISPGLQTASRIEASKVGGTQPSMSHRPFTMPEKPRR